MDGPGRRRHADRRCMLPRPGRATGHRGASGRAGRESRHSPRAARTATRGARSCPAAPSGRRRGPRSRQTLPSRRCGGAAPDGSAVWRPGRGLRTCRRRRPAAAPAPDVTESQVPKLKAPKPARRQTKHEREYDARTFRRTSRPRRSGLGLVERNGPPESLPMEATADRYRGRRRRRRRRRPMHRASSATTRETSRVSPRASSSTRPRPASAAARGDARLRVVTNGRKLFRLVVPLHTQLNTHTLT